MKMCITFSEIFHKPVGTCFIISTFPFLRLTDLPDAGVWWQRLLPLLHQHVGGPSVRPSGSGPYVWRPCCGGRLWESLFQSVPLPAVTDPLQCPPPTHHHSFPVYLHSARRTPTPSHPSHQWPQTTISVECRNCPEKGAWPDANWLEKCTRLKTCDCIRHSKYMLRALL